MKEFHGLVHRLHESNGLVDEALAEGAFFLRAPGRTSVHKFLRRFIKSGEGLLKGVRGQASSGPETRLDVCGLHKVAIQAILQQRSTHPLGSMVSV